MNNSSGMDFAGLVKLLIGLINDVIPVLMGLALLLFLWGGARFVYRVGNAKGKAEDRQALIWGLVALFVLFSLWGILRLMQESFLPSGAEGVSSDPWYNLR